MRAALVCVALLACESKRAAQPSFDRNALLASITDNVILPSVRGFNAAAAELQAKTAAWAGDAAQKAPAQQAWASAMKQWQRLEVLHVGPAAAAGVFKGGQGLRDEIYSWPTTNACVIDQELVRQGYEEPGFFSSRLVNAYGLFALEYLLFRTDGMEACASFVGIDDDWAALGADELERRRARYASRVAAHVADRAKLLADAWEPSVGNFAGAFAGAMMPYASAQEALDELYAAAYYLELRVKDRKLAIPAGLSTRCGQNTCPDDLESRWARHSKENLLENVKTVRALHVGALSGQGSGLDSALRALNAGELADDLGSKLDAALAAIEALPSNVETTLASDPEPLRAAHAAVKAVTDLMKTQLVTTLGLRVPQEGAGDND